MKICYIVPWFPFLDRNTVGAQQGIFEYRQVIKLNERGHEFRVISVKWQGQKDYEKINDGISVYRVPYIFDFTKKIRFPVPNFIKLTNRIKVTFDQWNPDLIVYSHAEYLTSLPIFYLKNKMKAPTIVAIDTLHGVSWFYGSIIVDVGAYLHSMLIVKPIFKIANGIHLIGNELCKYASKLGIDMNKTSIITRGVDTELFKPRDGKNRLKEKMGIKPEDAIVLYVGRLDRGKGVDCLLHAAKEMIPRYANLKFVIVGDGSLKHEYEQFAKSFSYNIIFTGYREDVSALMNISDIFVLPSLSEGAANVVMEASASGLPVIATKVGEVPRIVLDSKTGILIKLNDVNSLVNALKKLVDNPLLAVKMGEMGRIKIEEEYDWGGICRKIEKFYIEVIEKYKRDHI